ncbi:insulinase family protein [Zunongwangia atlantica]|nr:insulinase family protein [Zunongwangia atlantica]
MKDTSFLIRSISGSRLLLLTIIAIYVMGFSTTSLYSQSEKTNESDLIQGKLSNGFRYLIKPIPGENSLKMRFYVRAEESEEDFQLAHLIEHLAFRKSEAFPNGIYNIDSVFNSVGMKGPGRDIYAYSGTQLTEYIFNPNPENEKSLRLGLSWFFDISSGLKLDDEDILIEKKTLHQEHKLRTSGQEHVFVNQSIIDAAIIPCETSFDNYTRKIDNLKTSQIRKFYEAQYEPSNMVLMVVGSIVNVEELKIEIENTFKKLKPANNDKEFELESECKLAYLDQKDQFIVKMKRNLDQESRDGINFNFYYKDKVLLKNVKTKKESLKRRKQIILWDIVADAMRHQLNNLTEVYNPSYTISIEETAAKSNATVALHLRVNIPSDSKDSEVTLAKVFQQLGLLIFNGYEKKQWQEIKEMKLNEINSKFNDSLSYWEDELKNHIINGDLLNGNKNNAIESWLSDISVDEFNSYLKEFIGHAPNDIGILIPSDFENKFQNKKLRVLIDNNLMKTDQLTYKKSPNVLMTKNEVNNLEPVSYEKVSDSVSLHYRLNNGIHLVLVKDTTRKNSIKLQGFSPIGALDLNPLDFYSATYAPRIVRNSGVGEMNKFELRSILKNHSYLSVVPYVTATETGVKAETSTENTEVMMQLIYLYISNPRYDSIAYLDWKNNAKKSIESPHYNIERTNFENYIKEYFNPQKIFFASGVKYFEYSAMVDFDRAMKSYHKLFAMSDQFTYIITGDFQEEFILQLAQKYLGNLTSEYSSLNEDSGFAKQKKSEDRYVHFENKLSVSTKQNDIWYSLQFLREPDNHSWQEHLKFEFLKEVITEMIWKLRFEEGFSIYHINVKGEYHLNLSKYLLSIMLQCKPEEFDAIRNKSNEILEDITRGKIPNLVYEKVLDRMKMKYENSSKQLKSLERLYLNYSLNKKDKNENFSFPKSGELDDFFQTLNENRIMQYAREFLEEDQFFEFSM